MAATSTVDRNERGAPAGHHRPPIVGITLAALALAGVAAAAHYSGFTGTKARQAWDKLNNLADSAHAHPEPVEPPVPVIKDRSTSTWDHLVPVSEDEQSAIGFRFADVAAQADPIRLELTGRTAYDDTTITKVRPRFDTRVEKVYVKLGQKVKKGDPLVDLYSTDLASAKSDFQTKFVQWKHDVKLYDLRQKLVATGAISQQLWVDTQNEEQKSRLYNTLARDKLTVYYEIPDDELNPLLERISDIPADGDAPANAPPDKKKKKAGPDFGSITNKAKMTLRSKVDGYVISMAVVTSNFYESTDTLMEIAPLDHLWVWVNVYELDQDKVRTGQTIDIQFPFLEETIQGHIDYVAPEVSKDTRAVKVRAAIPNPEARLKSDMLLRAYLEIPPIPGHCVIPRLSMVALSGGEYVFVRRPHRADEKAKGGDKAHRVDKFERVKVRVAQENTDNVIVAEGLKPGQVVVTNGSLVLSQLYEDERMTVTGLPAQ